VALRRGMISAPSCRLHEHDSVLGQISSS
jgi:hypothetical protein